MQATVALAAVALYLAIRSAGVTTRAALPFAATPWATLIYQKYCTDIRSDYLAAALGLGAVALALAEARRRRAGFLVCAALMSAAASFTKLSAIAFVVPIAASLWAAGRRGAASRFALAATALFAMSLVAIQVISSGRFVENFRVAMVAGMRVPDLWRHGIPSMVQECVSDPFVGIPLVLGLAASAHAWRRGGWSLVHLYFLTAVAVTTVILASPGTSANHMVDVQLAATLVVAASVAKGDLAPRIVAALYAVLAVVMAAISVPLPHLPSVLGTLAAEGPHQRATVSAVRAELVGGLPYLASDPMFPLLNGERPLVQDAFMLGLSIRQGTPAGRDVVARIRRQEFSAIILRAGNAFPRDMDATDEAFMSLCALWWKNPDPLNLAVHETYDVRAVRRPFVVLWPKCLASDERPCVDRRLETARAVR
jgi:hypothetical protein